MSIPLPLHEPSPGAKTHCPYCAFQCGTVISGMPQANVTITGDSDFPVNRGRLCIKGWTASVLLNHSERLTQPLVRGTDGRLSPATWESALDLIVRRFQETQASHGREAVGVFGSGALTNEKAYWLGKFARVVLRTPHIDYNGRYCMSSAAAAGNRAFGIDRGLPFPVSDIVQARTLMIIGSNPFETLPPISQWFEQQQASGGTLIVVDPRRTPTAESAQIYLPITPGSDLALANGLLYLALEERLLDEQFIRTRTTGFDAVRRTVLAYHPAETERRTGISESMLRQTVRLLAKQGPSMILTGRGPEQQSKGVDTVLGFINLALALGQVGQPGSGYGCLTGQGNGQGGREHGQKADQLPGYRLIEVDAHREHVARVWGVEPSSLPRKGRSASELLDSLGQPDGINALMVMGSNVAVASPDASRIAKRLDSLDFLVVCDAFLNETSAFADVVLPVSQWAEEEGTMTNLEGRVIHRRPAQSPPGEVRSDLEVIVGLASRFGFGRQFPSAQPRDIFEEFRRATSGGLADYAGITYDRIDEQQGIFWPCPDENHPGTPRLFADRFYHADGKAKFHVVEDRPGGDEPDAAFPLYFTTGRYLEHYNSGAQTRQVGELSKRRSKPGLQIHPELAQHWSIDDGSLVMIESRRGRVEFFAERHPGIRPDTLFAPFHWGGRDAANILTQGALDPISRMPEIKLSAVRIIGVRPPESMEPRT
ncbi:molybdopterin oxidoreductase family protein [Zavarzinella formosa]|uniref:molybdopterin oxidoreductase family protein n=1 Tax=Zavarzinella formosa TaxID=360055 RepID=UPI0003112EB9|nr:molybdopterin oxidoreductase family protein [Zavarzinella formosa]